jgi:hypothetical protein
MLSGVGVVDALRLKKSLSDILKTGHDEDLGVVHMFWVFAFARLLYNGRVALG